MCESKLHRSNNSNTQKRARETTLACTSPTIPSYVATAAGTPTGTNSPVSIAAMSTSLEPLDKIKLSAIETAINKERGGRIRNLGRNPRALNEKLQDEEGFGLPRAFRDHPVYLTLALHRQQADEFDKILAGPTLRPPIRSRSRYQL